MLCKDVMAVIEDSYAGSYALEWDNVGIVSAKGCYVLDDVINSEYPKQAYELGKSL